MLNRKNLPVEIHPLHSSKTKNPPVTSIKGTLQRDWDQPHLQLVSCLAQRVGGICNVVHNDAGFASQHTCRNAAARYERIVVELLQREKFVNCKLTREHLLSVHGVDSTSRGHIAAVGNLETSQPLWAVIFSKKSDLFSGNHVELYICRKPMDPLG